MGEVEARELRGGCEAFLSAQLEGGAKGALVEASFSEEAGLREEGGRFGAPPFVIAKVRVFGFGPELFSFLVGCGRTMKSTRMSSN